MNQKEKRKHRVHFQAINLRVFLKSREGNFIMNIYLVCNAGMSTSIVVRKMQEAAKKQGLDDIHVEAFSVEILDQKVASADVVLLGPQIRHMLGDVKKVVNGKCPVDVVDMRDYGTLRGDKILAKALKMAGK